MSKTWMMFYSSLIMLSVMASKGCEPKAVQKEGVSQEEMYASPTDDALQALLVSESKGEGLSYFTLPSGRNYDSIPQDPKNPLNSFKVLLGKKTIL